jgi:hypothetical protein
VRPLVPEHWQPQGTSGRGHMSSAPFGVRGAGRGTRPRSRGAHGVRRSRGSRERAGGARSLGLRDPQGVNRGDSGAGGRRRRSP